MFTGVLLLQDNCIMLRQPSAHRKNNNSKIKLSLKLGPGRVSAMIINSIFQIILPQLFRIKPINKKLHIFVFILL
jgi:hypothetical protein